MGCKQSLSPLSIESISKTKIEFFYLQKPHRKKNKIIYISDLAIMISDIPRQDQNRVAQKIIELNQQNQ
jgi:hypothetical protein